MGKAAKKRRAARVICLDGRDRVLLLHWRDPATGELLWEPPGGGVEDGESDLEAARRELHEETGLSGTLEEPWAVEVERDFSWSGKRFAGPERFYGLALDDPVAVHPAALTDSETGALLGHGWFAPDEMGALKDRLEPPELASVVVSLVEMRRAGGQR